MPTRESSLGAWADKMPRVDGYSEAPAWEEAVPERTVLSPAELALEMKGFGTLLLISTGLLLGAAVFTLFSLSSVVGGESTEGVVVDLRRIPSKGGESYAPIVAYLADDGYEYEIDGHVSGFFDYEIGDEVAVVYSPHNPYNATIADFQQLWLLPTLLGGGGLVFLAGTLGLGVYVVRKAGWRIFHARTLSRMENRPTLAKPVAYDGLAAGRI
jgi:hypothetical protein